MLRNVCILAAIVEREMCQIRNAMSTNGATRVSNATNSRSDTPKGGQAQEKMKGTGTRTGRKDEIALRINQKG